MSLESPGVLDVVAGLGAVDAASCVDVETVTDACDLRRAEEGEAAGERQDAPDAEAVGAGLVAGALVVGVRVSGLALDSADGLSLAAAFPPSEESLPQAASAKLRRQRYLPPAAPTWRLLIDSRREPSVCRVRVHFTGPPSRTGA